MTTEIRSEVVTGMRHATRYPEYDEREAREMIGQIVETVAPFRRLPLRTRGRVVGAGLEIPKFITAHGWWRVVIEWQVQKQGFPLRDWVAKWEIEQYCQFISN